MSHQMRTLFSHIVAAGPLTTERRFSRMHPHMYFQRACGARRIGTATRPLALEGPLASVRPLVDDQRRATRGGKDALLLTTPELILGRSMAQLTMSPKIPPLGSRIVTVFVLTLEWLLSRMRSHVTLNSGTLCRRISAARPATSVWPFPRVRPNMRLQVVSLARPVTASGPATRVRPLVSVYPAMHHQITQLVRGVSTTAPLASEPMIGRRLRTRAEAFNGSPLRYPFGATSTYIS